MIPPADTHNLAGRHILLTGGTGSVGRTLIDYLAQCEMVFGQLRVTVLTRDPDAFVTRHPAQANHPWLSLLCGNLMDLPPLPGDISDVVHAAADVHFDTAYASWIDQIVGGTQALLEQSMKAGVARFLLLSSGAIYGPQPDSVVRIAEDYPGAPNPLLRSSTYGQAKRVAEQLCTIFHHEQGLETVVARLFAFGSTHTPRNGPYALGNFVRDALAAIDAPITVEGDGRAVRSYLGGRDMAHALVAALTAGVPGRAYNVGSEEAITVAELARHVAARLSPGRMVAISGASGDGQRSRYVPDVARIAALGAARRTDLDAVIDAVAGVAATRH